MGPWDGWHMGTWGWGGLMMGGLAMLVFWGGVIALAFFAVRAWTQSGRSERRSDRPEQGRRDTPLEILQERYARGELTRAEYQELRRDLEV